MILLLDALTSAGSGNWLMPAPIHHAARRNICRLLARSGRDWLSQLAAAAVRPRGLTRISHHGEGRHSRCQARSRRIGYNVGLPVRILAQTQHRLPPTPPSRKRTPLQPADCSNATFTAPATLPDWRKQVSALPPASRRYRRDKLAGSPRSGCLSPRDARAAAPAPRRAPAFCVGANDNKGKQHG